MFGGKKNKTLNNLIRYKTNWKQKSSGARQNKFWSKSPLEQERTNSEAKVLWSKTEQILPAKVLWSKTEQILPAKVLWSKAEQILQAKVLWSKTEQILQAKVLWNRHKRNERFVAPEAGRPPI